MKLLDVSWNSAKRRPIECSPLITNKAIIDIYNKYDKDVMKKMCRGAYLLPDSELVDGDESMTYIICKILSTYKFNVHSFGFDGEWIPWHEFYQGSHCGLTDKALHRLADYGLLKRSKEWKQLN